MHSRKLILILFLISTSGSLSAQQTPAEGFFTSEANVVCLGNQVIVSIKKHNPTKSEIDNAAKPPKNAPLNYLMAPFEAVNISMFNKGFESKLYSLGKDGNVAGKVFIVQIEGRNNPGVSGKLKIGFY